MLFLALVLSVFSLARSDDVNAACAVHVKAEVPPSCEWQVMHGQLNFFTPRMYELSMCTLSSATSDDCRATCELMYPDCAAVHFCEECVGHNCRLLSDRVGGMRNLKLVQRFGESVEYSEIVQCAEQNATEPEASTQIVIQENDAPITSSTAEPTAPETTVAPTEASIETNSTSSAEETTEEEVSTTVEDEETSADEEIEEESEESHEHLYELKNQTHSSEEEAVQNTTVSATTVSEISETTTEILTTTVAQEVNSTAPEIEDTTMDALDAGSFLNGTQEVSASEEAVGDEEA